MPIPDFLLSQLTFTKGLCKSSENRDFMFFEKKSIFSTFIVSKNFTNFYIFFIDPKQKFWSGFSAV